ncbi:MAG: type III polyketide synthase [Bacteroidetes bacterium]|nr:type III polyketide synthase [Bacteroidota bacterium]
MSYITAIDVANPKHCFTQETIAGFMVKAMKLNQDEERKLRALYRATGIETRNSVLADYGKVEDFDFYPNRESLPQPSTVQRMELFRKFAPELSVTAAQNCLKKVSNQQISDITHLIVVSCTGLYAPGLDIDLVKRLGLKTSVQRTCINFMGCYAAFNAIKLADTICKENTDSKVLIVCTELCSIHFQHENTEDNLLANSLFADGSAALLIEPQPRAGLNLRPVRFYADLALNGEEAMAWKIGDLGFEMRLSSYVPEIIRGGIKNLTQSLLGALEKKVSEVDFFAIHPGGKKILEVIESELGLSKKQNHFSYEVLRKHGNMSSPTVIFVLNELLEKLSEADHKKTILSFAFGPGLTLESSLLAIEFH